MKIFYTKKFEREYAKIPIAIQKKAEVREKVFKKNPFQATLRTHKLSGSLDGLWSFSVDLKYRILFEFINEKTAYFYSIGNHDIYK